MLSLSIFLFSIVVIVSGQENNTTNSTSNTTNVIVNTTNTTNTTIASNTTNTTNTATNSTSISSENSNVCPSGQYVNNSNCTFCPNGQYQEHNNFTGTNCKSCSVGMYAQNATVNKCDACLPGQIQTFVENVEYMCQNCPSGKMTVDNVRTSCDANLTCSNGNPILLGQAFSCPSGVVLSDKVCTGECSESQCCFPMCESGNHGIKNSRQCQCGYNSSVICGKNTYCIESNQTVCSICNQLGESGPKYFCSVGSHLGLNTHYKDCLHDTKNTDTCQCWTDKGLIDEQTFGDKSVCYGNFNICNKKYGHCMNLDYCPNRNGAVTNQQCSCQIPNIIHSNTKAQSTCDSNMYCSASVDCVGDCSNRCSSTKTPVCTKTSGSEANELDSINNKYCSCGLFGLCNTSKPFCISDIGECSSTSSNVCHNQDGTILNVLPCTCGNSLGINDNCAANMYCNIDSNNDGSCSGLTCSMAGIDCVDKTVTISSNEIYNYYGPKSGVHLCISKQCNDFLDIKSCCNECPFGNWNDGSCSVQCPNSFNCTDYSNGMYIKPSESYISQPKVASWEIDRINNGLFTGRCRYPDCDQAQYSLNERTVLSCCIEADKCQKSRHGNSLCDNNLGYYDKDIWDEKYCIGDTCTMQECCHYAQCNCSNGIAAKAPVCKSNNGTEKCQKCNNGYFLNGDICQKGSLCSVTEFAKYQASGVDDTICEPLTVCNHSQFIQVNHTNTTDRVCAPLSSCLENQYVSIGNTLYTDLVCSTISVCNSVQYEKVAPSVTSDRVCQNISNDCDYSVQYLFQNYTQSQDRICRNISNDCDYSVQYLFQNYTQSQDRICRNISNDCDYSMQYLVQNYTQSQDRICGTLSTCNYSTHYENITGKSNTRDNICIPLTTCSDYEYISTQKTNTSDYICSPLTTCNITQFERIAPQKNAIENNMYISDRICSQCLPGDGDTCLGCMNPESCNYDKRAKVNGQCSQHQCTYYSYNISHSEEIVFSNGRLMNNIISNISLQNNRWVRLEQHTQGTPAITVLQNGIQQTTIQVYDSSQLYYTFFEIPPSVSNFTVTINNKNIPVQQDCITEILYSSECLIENNNKNCINGVQNGTKAFWWKQRYAPKNGGRKCPTNPYYESCLNYECDRDCIETCQEWSNCQRNGIPVKCGEIGEKIKVCQIHTSSKYNGKKCTENQTMSCRGEIPHGKCDCDGHEIDGCGICGGDCCPLGQFRDSCGICNGTNDCIKKLRLQSIENHEHSEVIRIVMPSIAFALLTSIFTVLCIWACH